MTRIACIIPVRGGSKGVPRKNLIDVAGKPLVAWTIEQALALPGVDVCVSTEDAEIAAVASQWGAEVIDRPDELAEDTTASEPVIEHAIGWLAERGRRPDVVIFLQATSPVRLPGTLQRALDQFTSSGADSLLSVVAESPFLWRDGSSATAMYDYNHRPRRQDIPLSERVYRENGSLYITRTEIYEQQHNRLGGKIGLFVLEPSEAVDIDGPFDLAVAAARLSGSTTT